MTTKQPLRLCSQVYYDFDPFTNTSRSTVCEKRSFTDRRVPSGKTKMVSYETGVSTGQHVDVEEPVYDFIEYPRCLYHMRWLLFEQQLEKTADDPDRHGFAECPACKQAKYGGPWHFSLVGRGTHRLRIICRDCEYLRRHAWHGTPKRKKGKWDLRLRLRRLLDNMHEIREYGVPILLEQERQIIDVFEYLEQSPAASETTRTLRRLLGIEFLNNWVCPNCNEVKTSPNEWYVSWEDDNCCCRSCWTCGAKHGFINEVLPLGLAEGEL